MGVNLELFLNYSHLELEMNKDGMKRVVFCSQPWLDSVGCNIHLEFLFFFFSLVFTQL